MPVLDPPPRLAERPAPVLRAIPAPRPGARITPCCWPIGEPGKSSFRFCDVDAIAGKPYCEEHSALAYVKIRDRKEDAA
jgi:GcrA cell cycle regulator